MARATGEINLNIKLELEETIQCFRAMEIIMKKLSNEFLRDAEVFKEGITKMNEMQKESRRVNRS